MKSFGWMVTSLLIVYVASTSRSVAQKQDAPPAECGQVTTATGETDTSIQECMNELLNEQLRMIDGLEQMDEEVRAITASLLAAGGTSQLQATMMLSFVDDDNKENIQLMRSQHQRAVQENQAVEDEDHDDAFAKADQEKGKNCKFSDMPFVESLEGAFPPGLKPFSGSTFDAKFGDGKCNAFKARIDNPGEPDDNQVVQVNERSENMCERACEDRLSDSDTARSAGSPRPRKEERKGRIASALTDNIAAARRANAELDTAKASMASLRLRLSGGVVRVAGDDSDSCEPVDAATPLEIAGEAAGFVKNAIAVVTASLELAKETARPPTNQDVAGFNTAAAETPFAVAAGISKIIEESAGVVEAGLKTAARIALAIQQHAEAQCLEKVQTGVVELKAAGEHTSGQIAALEAKVDALSARLDEVLKLLNTPPGRRPDFPKP